MRSTGEAFEAGAPMAPEHDAEWTRHWIDLLSAAILAGSTIATAWSGYQSALWNGHFSSHNGQSLKAVVRVGKLSTLALQRTTVHVNLFVQWVVATNRGDNRTADFLFVRFPEPLKSAATTWRAAHAQNGDEAANSPFDMPEYSLPERTEADKWEQIAAQEASLAESANDISNRYLLFTIIFASVLFFAGISGKCQWSVIDSVMLILGALTLIGGVTGLIWLPRA